MTTILILSNESGGGHKQTARVLSQALQRDDRAIRIVSTFQELFADLDHSAKFLGISGEEIYNKWILQNEGSQFFYKFFFFCIYYSFFVLYRKTLIKILTAFFEREKPDLVISVIPILNREIAAAINQYCPFLIVQTDLFEYEEQSPFWRWLVPCGAWFVADKTTYMASGTEKGYRQALNYKPNANRVVKLSGTVIDPRFLRHEPLDVETERSKLGLEPNMPLGLFLYGGYPPGRILKLAKQLDKFDIAAQFIFICGKNEQLYNQLKNLATRYKKIVLGYNKAVPYYMRIADFVVGKAGPGTIMESTALGLPLLLDVSHIMPHEENNAAWVLQKNLGMTFKTPRQLHACIQRLGQVDFEISKQLFKNRAVFEVAELVEKILADKRH